jgi:flagellar basal-body rod protein FlgB
MTMGNSAIFDRTISQIQDRLDLISKSHKLISNNLANVSTPGYQAKDVSFKSHLQESIKDENLRMTQSNQRHLAPEGLSSAAISAEVEEKGPVSLEQEMMKLARNSVEYQYMVAILNKKFAMLKNAISEGGT